MKIATKKIERTMSGLRDAMFETLEEVKARVIDPDVGKTCGLLGKVIIDSVRVQMDYERMRLDSEVPAVLPEMKLLPPLGKA